MIQGSKHFILVVMVVLLCAYTKTERRPTTSVKYTSKVPIKVPEPSDIVNDKETKELFIVSDNGILFKCDALGKIIQKTDALGWDFEGVEIKGNSVYVSDESSRKVFKYNKKDLSLENTYTISYLGGRNEGFESLAYNESKKCFVLISEKNPVTIVECDESFQITNQTIFEGYRDISAARWHNGFMYLLSDEDRTVLQCDPLTYKVKQAFRINVLNPEGICFNPENNTMIIAADDIQCLYNFNALQ